MIKLVFYSFKKYSYHQLKLRNGSIPLWPCDLCLHLVQIEVGPLWVKNATFKIVYDKLMILTSFGLQSMI